MIKNGFFSKKRLMAMSLAAMMLMSASGCGKTEESADATTEATNTSAEAVDTSATDVSEDEIEVPEGFSLVWHDEFNGTELNEADWNREEHQVGWVNNELQEYIPTDEYSFVKNGELVIQPKKFEDEDGNLPEKISSSAINTWLFNEDTIRQVLDIVMKDSLKVNYGEMIGKTIIFAKNHKHAEKILEVFIVHMF